MKLREFIEMIPPEDLDRNHEALVVLLLDDGESPLWYSTLATEKLDRLIKTLGLHKMDPLPLPNPN